MEFLQVSRKRQFASTHTHIYIHTHTHTIFPKSTLYCSDAKLLQTCFSVVLMAKKHLRRKSCTSANVKWPRDSLLLLLLVAADTRLRLASGGLVGDASGDVGDSERISGSRFEIESAEAEAEAGAKAIAVEGLVLTSVSVSALAVSVRVACFSS